MFSLHPSHSMGFDQRHGFDAGSLCWDFVPWGLSLILSSFCLGFEGKVCILKGTVSRDFLLMVFFMNQFPPAPEYSVRTVSNFFENSRRYSQVKVHHWYQWHRRQIFPSVLPQICRCQWSWWQIAIGVNDTGSKRHWWQTMRTIIKLCWQLKMNLKNKNYLYANSTTQRCPKEKKEIFLIEDFFHLSRCQRHWWCTLSCEYLRKFLKKFETDVMV